MNRSDRKLLVLHCPAGGGHKAAARAIAEAAEARGVEADVIDALSLTPAWFARAYVSGHLMTTEHTPQMYGDLYAAWNHRGAFDGVRTALDRSLGARLLARVVAADPIAVVATHFFPLEVLAPARAAAARRSRRPALAAPLVGVVTDYAAHAFWAEPGVDVFTVPRGRAARDLVRHGVAPDRVVATGIPIREAFGRIAPPRFTERGPLRVLVTSGGFGVGPMVDVIRSFAGAPVRLTCVCGDNPARVEQAWRAAAEAGVEADVVGFEKDMPRRLAEAHVVVGKSGGLTVSETLAAGRPLVVVGACPGQETENLAWLESNGAAVASAPDAAGAVVAALARAGRLPAMADAARSLAAPDAAARVVDVALRAAGLTLGDSFTRRAA